MLSPAPIVTTDQSHFGPAKCASVAAIRVPRTCHGSLDRDEQMISFLAAALSRFNIPSFAWRKKAGTRSPGFEGGSCASASLNDCKLSRERERFEGEVGSRADGAVIVWVRLPTALRRRSPPKRLSKLEPAVPASLKCRYGPWPR